MKRKDDHPDKPADDGRQRSGAVRASFGALKQKAVMAASRQVDPEADARQAFGFMPMTLKGAAIRWRGL